MKSFFLTFKLKNSILPTIFVLFTIFLVIFSKDNLNATKNGLLLWANSVVPALFPFFIATELLGHTNVVTSIGKLLNKYMKPIFNVPGIGAYAFIMGIISGYPVGAKIVTKFREDGICSKAEAERLLAFTNNSGPLFIIGTVGVSMFGYTLIGILLFITHFISCILVGIVFRFWKCKDNEKINLKSSFSASNVNISFSNLGQILSESIMNSVNTIVMIGGFVILFCVVISILTNSGVLRLICTLFTPIFNLFNIDINYIKPIISGLVELTNGVNILVQIPTKSLSSTIVITSFLLGCGGLSIMLQVLSIISKSDISIKPYVLGKLLHGTIASILTYVFIHIFPIFSLDITQIVSQNVNKISPAYNYLNPYCLIISMVILSLIFILFSKRKNINTHTN